MLVVKLFLRAEPFIHHLRTIYAQVCIHKHIFMIAAFILPSIGELASTLYDIY